MSRNEAKHVFVSYVHEDNTEVDKLCRVLEAAKIPYWRDRTSLGPGDAWKAKIREAIRGGSLVFLACFSDNSRAKDKSHMNEELTIAVEEYRKMPQGLGAPGSSRSASTRAASRSGTLGRGER